MLVRRLQKPGLCLIMGPLDMKGLLGAVTVMGTLMMELGMFGLEVPTFILTSLCWQLWNPHKTVSPIITRYVVCTSHCRRAVGSLRPSNSRCPRPQRRALLADFLQFREGMVQAGHMPLKGRCVMHIPSITNTKPPHFSLTLTSSPCLIMSPKMAPFGLKLLGCTSQIPSKNGFSPVRLASMIARTLSFQAIARLPSRPPNALLL